MNTFLENQNWRYATKKFDATKKVSTEDLETIKEAIRLSSSSYGLQPYKVLIIENPDVREQLKPFSWNQSQITDASQLIVFVNETKITEESIDSYVKNMSETRSIPAENLQGYSDFMKSKLLSLSEEQTTIWTAKQTYLALANLLNAAAELKIDVTPIEGFESEKYNQILNLTEKGLNASVVATIGYRHNDDDTQHYKKVRKSTNELFINL
ncbi:NAD(P)H-dependent oxidoreductase [Flavobacterium sp.]|uniref:NAD(P)H-dependent oxidoreductase n=1 Tax=Flavobacterium sp. TaxID=239 RepID=UPI00286DA783|nr:NAD(P)H-dependent oxidoreductase [Flavobacterium sp.]